MRALKNFVKTYSKLYYQSKNLNKLVKFSYNNPLQFDPIPQNNSKQENPYQYLQVKKRMNYIQHKDLLMHVSQENMRQLTKEEAEQHYLVKNFFPQFADEIKLFESGKKDLREEEHINFPRNSWNKTVLPLSTNEKMRNKFSRFYVNSIRIGVLMEILDYQAVITSYGYLYNKRDEATIVTASVDNINFYKKLKANRDLIITSYPTYIGKSSLEIAIDIYQPGEDGTEELMGNAVFLMVARQKQDHTKSYLCPKLKFDGEEFQEEAQLRFAIGEKKSSQRRQQSKNKLEIKPPTNEEITYVHRYYLHNNVVKNNQDWMTINESQMSKNLLMHMQDRNLHGKIFGGYLMREAFEIGWLSAYKHAQGIFPEIYHIDDFQFLQPVTVGDIIQFKSRVTYVKGDLIHVYVEVIKRELDGQEIKTNDLNLTFLIPESEEKSKRDKIAHMKRVYPVSYEEAMLQCDSRRRLSLLY